MSYTTDPNGDPSAGYLYDIDHADTDRAIENENNVFAGDLSDPTTAAAVIDDTGSTRHNGTSYPGGSGVFTNDTSDPTNFPQPGASLPTDANPTRAAWDPTNGPPPGGSRTGTVNGIDITTSAGQPSPNNVQTGYGTPYQPTTDETGIPGSGVSSSSIPAAAAASGVSTLPGGSGPGGYNQPLLGGTPVGPHGGSQPIDSLAAQGFQRQGDTRIITGPDGRMYIADPNGYANPNVQQLQDWQSRSAVDTNAQRSAPDAVEKLRYLDQIGLTNAKEKAILAELSNVGGGGPQGYQNTQSFQSYVGQHNPEAVRNGLPGQQLQGPANPLTNDQAYATYKDIRQSLEAIGATNVTMDTYHNIHWDGPTGQHFSVAGGDGIPLADWQQRADQLKGIAAGAQAPAAAPPGGNGYGAPRGNYGPPRAPQQQAAAGYPYEGQVAPFDANQGTFASVTSGRQIPTPPLPVAAGDFQSPKSPNYPPAY